MSLEKYKKYLEKEAKKFKLTGNDLSNLYDLLYIVDNRDLEANGIDKWARDLFERLEPIVIPELYKGEQDD